MTSPPPLPTHHSDALGVHLLGVVEFDSAVRLGERLAFETGGRADRHGTVLLCEHPPVVTVGRDGSHAHLHPDDHEFRSREMEVVWVNRGGGAAVHCPGQLCAHVVCPLDRLGMSPLAFRDALRWAVVDLCEELRVPAELDGQGGGVSVRTGRLAGVGVCVRRDVTTFGLWLNVAPPMELIRLARPPSAPRHDRLSRDEHAPRMTSLAAQRLRPTGMPPVRTGLTRHLAARLGYDQFHLFTGHPLLRRTRKTVYVPA